jgi:hypothetical protein
MRYLCVYLRAAFHNGNRDIILLCKVVIAAAVEPFRVPICRAYCLNPFQFSIGAKSLSSRNTSSL